ncbi:MAG: hypothetical protein JSU86_17485 [Phycisphaerales bacterium]|nr:MAG: hypothetical protein JSU86_17485 [Phycisphaerales bacterium]
MERLKQAGGNWVTGDRFWGREKDISLFIERLDEGAHPLLVAQRRMGKTSLMRETARRLADRYVCLFVDLQKSWKAADAVVALSLAVHPHRTLWQKGRHLFANILSNVADRIDEVEFAELGLRLRAGLTSGNWAQKGDQLFGILAASEKPVVLLLDEVPILVSRLLKGEDFSITPQRRAETEEFMSWLRENSIRHQGQVRIVMSGSIGFEPVLRRAHLTATINNFVPFELKPWDDATAIGCLNALANEYGVRFQGDAPGRMVSRLGCNIPHHVQMFFYHAYGWCKRRDRMQFGPDDVETVYHQEMLSTRGHAELTHYEDRLKLVLGQEAFPLALEMLTEAAVTGHLTRDALAALEKYFSFPEQSTAEAQEEILRVLEHDGYLRLTESGYVFVSKLVRDWWKARYEFAFTPISQRKE